MHIGAELAETYGLFIMLLMTALVAIILGMGMPTVAVYVVLVTIVAPTVVDMGVFPLGAHLFLFYFGIMSMITPPIGLNLFVTSGITGMSLIQVVRAAAPFVAVLLVFLVLVTYVPILSTALPYALMGPEIVTR